MKNRDAKTQREEQSKAEMGAEPSGRMRNEKLHAIVARNAC